MEFLNTNVFTTPEWLLDEDILRRIEHNGALERVKNLQSRILDDVMAADVMIRLNENFTFNGDEAYSPLEMLSDLRQGVWSEIYDYESVDPYRRNLQRMYINNIASAFENDESGRVDIETSDIRPFLRVELNTLNEDLDQARSRISDELTKAHIEDIQSRISDILDSE
jgi:hypothetical protein